jgi:Clostripain family
VPTITIRDEQGKELLEADLSEGGLGRYLRSAASLRSVIPLARSFSKPLADGGGGELALATDHDIPVGKSGELTIGGGASVAIGVHPSGGAMLAGSDLQAPVTVPNGTIYTSLTVEALLKAGLAGTQGHIGFGFEAGTALRYAYFHPFDVVGSSLTLRDAVKTMVSAAVFPADVEDLTRLAEGSHVSLAGEGELSFSGEAVLSSTANLLATPGLPLIGTVSLTQGASVAVKATWTVSGEFELRVSKLSASQARLAFYRRRGRSLSVSAKAQAGVTVNIRDSDLIATLMRAISSDPEADLLALVNAGLEDEPILAIQRAIEASIDRSLTLSAQIQVSALRDDEALFAYDIDLRRLDAQGKSAVDEALHGRQGLLYEAGAAASGPIRLIASAARQLRERKTTWRINVLGILNVASFAELVREGTLMFDPVSGALTAADKVSGRRIRVTSRPLESDAEKLRKVLFESLMVTAAYQASRALGSAVSLTAEHLYLEQRGRTKRADLEDHYRALIALGLCDEAERDARLGAEPEFGSSTFVIENHFDPAACDAMFLDADGEPHDMEHYEGIARRALLALVPADDSVRSYRRLALASDTIWAQVRTLGGDIDRALPSHIRHDPLRLGVVRGDVFTVVWWARAMSKAAAELVAMRKFLGARNATSLAADPAFLKAKTKLSDALAGVVATTEARFDDPWDVLAMDDAAARLGRLDSVIVSTRFAARYAEPELVPAAIEAAPVSRGARTRGARVAATTRGDRDVPRDWTAEERDVFARHVVNLREGKLSGEGSFSSSREQMERIFSELIPAYAREQKALGRRPRVFFYAHGGLTEERNGLRPVLGRRRFWELNNVYPVYFVWETGLRETLLDIVGGAIRPSRAARGAVTDFAIERLARNGGEQVWGQMKKSAENAAGPDGGARLVASLAGGLWKKLGGEIEFHALGHSAGAIFHAHFLPLLVAERPSGVPPVDVRTLHLLAPAITIGLFKKKLLGLVGSGKPITALTMYTMTDELEQADDAGPYSKSLLYLVSRSFEDEVPTPILGMQEALKRDLQLIRFFGLAGTEKVADVVFSRSLASAALRDRSESMTHGGFDNDIATMTSMIRRVLDLPDTSGVIDYFEEAVPGFDKPAIGVPRAEARPAAPAPAASTAVRRAPAVRAAPARKKWTVMVWMAGDNDLESFGDRDLAEMKQVGSNGDINVTVQFDSMRDDRTRRYSVTKGGQLDADVVEELGETNTGDPVVAIDFFRWAIERYPAERLLGVIWNHGSGIDETDVYARAGARGMSVVRGVAAGPGDIQRSLVRRALSSRHRRAVFATTVSEATQDRAIAYDDTSRDFLDNIELKKVLAEVKKQTGRVLDVLGFDACLMNMAEVAYQLKGTARVVVGSEELEPGDGWPYDRVLKSLAANPDVSGAELGTQIVDHYIDSYQAGSITQSALDLSRLDEVARATNTLATALITAIRSAAEYTAVTKTLNATQRFDTADFVDLGHFCQELGKRSKAAAVKRAATAVLESLTGPNGFVLAERYKGSDVSDATGVAIYFPRGPVSKVYGRLDFAKATSWRRFLEAYHKA